MFVFANVADADCWYKVLFVWWHLAP